MVLTAEEKAERKLQMKLNAARLVQQQRKEHLYREVAFGLENWKQVKAKWMAIMGRVTMKDVQEEMKMYLAAMEQWMDSRTETINLTLEEIDEFHLQCSVTSQGQVKALDMLFATFLDRVAMMRQVYDTTLQNTTKDWMGESETMKTMSTNKKENTKAMLFWMEQIQRDSEEVMSYNMTLFADDQRGKNAERLEALRMRMNEKIKWRWSQVSQVLTDYAENTASRRGEIVNMAKKDAAELKVIKYQTKKTERVTDLIARLKTQLEGVFGNPEARDKMEDLRMERAKFLAAFKLLRAAMKEEKQLDLQQMLYLIQVADDILDYLRRSAVKGERILQLFTICRRLETEKEKVLLADRRPPAIPSYIQDDLDLDERSDHSHKGLEAVPEFPASLAEQYKCANNLWLKYARANLSRLGLLKDICGLRRENVYLQNILRFHFSKMSPLAT